MFAVVASTGGVGVLVTGLSLLPPPHAEMPMVSKLAASSFNLGVILKTTYSIVLAWCAPWVGGLLLWVLESEEYFSRKGGI